MKFTWVTSHKIAHPLVHQPVLSEEFHIVNFKQHIIECLEEAMYTIQTQTGKYGDMIQLPIYAYKL